MRRCPEHDAPLLAPILAGTCSTLTLRAPRASSGTSCCMGAQAGGSSGRQRVLRAVACRLHVKVQMRSRSCCRHRQQYPLVGTSSGSARAAHPISFKKFNTLRRHHHKYPMDFDRLVFPPAAAAIVISLFYWLLHALLPMVRVAL